MSQAPKDLRSFLDRLRLAGCLVEVDTEVDAELEVAEIHRRVVAAGGPALLFRKVKGSPFPLTTNLFGSSDRIELAFGRRPRELVQELACLPEELLPPTLGKLWERRKLFGSLLRVGLRRGGQGPVCEERQQPARLTSLPALKTWPRDGGRFITLPLVYTEHPTTQGHNLGMYRVQIYDDERCGVHTQIHKGGGFHIAAAEAQESALPVNIHVGGPPALMLAAIAPLPENVPELLLASLVLGERLPMSANPAGPLPLVANAEFALVGSIEAGARHPEGPFGDHYGYYSEVHDYPLLRCDAVLHRKDAIFPATVVGKPRQEDFYLGDHLQELLRPLIRVALPSVIDLWSYGETGYHSLSAAIVRERYKREAMVSGFRILGEGQLSLTKFLLLTDGGIDLRDFKATLTHVLERADFRTDLFLFANLSMDSLDYAGPVINQGSKGILLGVGEPVRKLPEEYVGKPAAGVEKVAVFCPGCLVVQVGSYEDDLEAAERVARDPAFGDWPLVVLADDAQRAAKSAMNFLWTTFTRFDPAGDIRAAQVDLVHNHASFTPPVVIDSRMKPGYPAELFCDEETAATVDRRWKEYFPAGMEMGDSDRASLD